MEVVTPGPLLPPEVAMVAQAWEYQGGDQAVTALEVHPFRL